MPQLKPRTIEIYLYDDNPFAMVHFAASEPVDAAGTVNSLEMSIPIHDLTLTPAEMLEQAIAKGREFLGSDGVL